MKLKNLKTCYVYTPKTSKVDGEIQKKWKFKDKLNLNIQQDINELDRTSAGIIDFEKIKIRSDYEIDINKNDGISLIELEIEDDYSLEPPRYIVVSKTVIGKSIMCVCEINHKK